MKRFLTLIVAVCAFFAASAQYPMVTLDHNGKLSFFSTPFAFQAAIDAAEKGDVIYLSEGDFVMDVKILTLTKRVSIVGAGQKSHIVGKISVNMADSYDSLLCAKPLFDGVRLDDLEFYGDYGNANGYNSYDNLHNSEIRRCRISELKGGAWAGNIVLFDKCVFDRPRFGGPGLVTVTNSKINGTRWYTDTDMQNITAINCNLTNARNYPRYMISCIYEFNTGSGYPEEVGTHSIINSLLNFDPQYGNNGRYVSLNNCYIFDSTNQPILDDNWDCPLNLEELGYFGQDGTVVGIMGGESPFSENPSVPTVDSEKSSVEYDAENNQLKVSITVKAD